jgi:cytochrome b561
MQTDSLVREPSRTEQNAGQSRGGTILPTPFHIQRPPFDRVTRSLHWVTVFLVLALFATAWLHALAEEQKSGFTLILLQVHRSIGVIVWTLTACRLAWRMTFARLPPFPARMSGLHRTAVKASEYALYALLLVQPATGLLTTLFGGRPFALLFWTIPPLLPRDAAIRDAFHATHEFGAWTLASLVAIHAGVALFHHVALRDDVLACMAPGIVTPRAGREI